MRDRRQLGTETLGFIDGEKKEIKIFAVSNFEIMQLKRQFRRIVTKSNAEPQLEVFDDEIIIQVIKRAMGSQITEEDLKSCENDLTDIYNKYFGSGLLNAEKKEELLE